MKILTLLFVMLMVISTFGGVSAVEKDPKNYWARGIWVWDGWIKIDGGQANWWHVNLQNVQVNGTYGNRSYSHPKINLYVIHTGYPKKVIGFYNLTNKAYTAQESVKSSGPLTWNYSSDKHGAKVVDDFIAHGYYGATWHFIWDSHKLTLSDYSGVYSKTEVPMHDKTKTIPTNVTIQSSDETTVPMQGTGMPIMPLVVALTLVIGALVYNKRG